jgi:5-formyltetrahydrofolate cyclo-ligase
MTKAELRSKMKSERGFIREEDRLAWNEAIYHRIIHTGEYLNAGILFGYASFGTEADTGKILEHAQNMHKKLYLPRVESRDRMEFYQLHDRNRLAVSNFGVPEPKPDKNLVYLMDASLQEKPLMLLPGLAFDQKGNRIGYGAGYYDKYLAGFPEDYYIKIGICYDFQLMERIPAGQYDVRADMIITPAGSFRV